MNKMEHESFSCISLNDVKVITEPVKQKTASGVERLYFHIEYESAICRDVPRRFCVMLQGKAAKAVVNMGDYVNITAAKLFTSKRKEDEGMEALGVSDPGQLTIVVHDGGFVSADDIV